MISQPLYVWYHIQYMWDILSTIFMTSYPLSMTTQTCVLITPHSAYVWHHLHYRRRHIHSITPSHNLYDFTSTSGMTSHPLYLWHHIQYICYHHTAFMTTQRLYLTSHPPYLTSQLRYLCLHPVCRTTYTLYMRHHSHYLCPHTHCIDNITPTLCMTSHSPYVWHRLHYTRHHILTLRPQTTVFMSSHPLYLTSCPLYLCHHLHCIDDITPSVFLRSHPL